MNASRSLSLMLVLILMASVAVPWPATWGGQVKPEQKIYIVAVRDSNLLTMCPQAGEVKLAGGRTWKSDNNVLTFPSGSKQTLHFLDGSPSVHVTLPLPARASSDPLSGGPDASGPIVLNRVAADPELERKLEREFLDLKGYSLAYSLDQADVVFLAEGYYASVELWSKKEGSGRQLNVSPLWGGDRRATFMQAALGIAVPADAYRRHPGDADALVAARVWEGSVVWQPSRTSRTPEAAVAEALVRQFLNKEKRPPSHFPLCAASAIPLPMPVASTDDARVEPARAGEKGRIVSLPDQIPQAGGATIKVDVALVAVPVMATDSTGRAVANLQASDFRVFEDNVEQQIDRLVTAGDPFDVALMLDTSGSMSFEVQDLQRAALVFVEAMRPQDRIMIASFNDRVYLHSESIADHSRLRPAILQIGRGAGTMLYDALDLLVADRLNRMTGRKAIVLFTDGVDTSSQSLDAAQSLLSMQGSQVVVYGVQYDTEAQNQSRSDAFAMNMRRSGYQPLRLPLEVTDIKGLYANATAYLQGVSEASGGVLYPVQSLDKLKETFAQIAWELGRQYTLCYYSTNPARDGSLRHVRVTTTRQDVNLRFRTAYRSSR
jgi:VWFA-related protein